MRVLLDSDHGGIALFEFPQGETSRAVRHRTVDEIWYFVSGRGRMWTSNGEDDGFDVSPGSASRSQSAPPFRSDPTATSR